MAGITHAFVSAIQDGADTSLVRPVDWNAAHIGLTIVRKTADEIVNNSTTLQNDDHLLLAVAANEIWEIILITRLAGVADASCKGAFTVPTGGAIARQTALKTGGTGLEEVDATTSFEIGSTSVMTSYTSLARCVYIGGSNAGNVQLQWAQLTATVGDTTMRANSFIIAYKLSQR